MGDSKQEMSTEETELRNREIYMRKQEGVIQSQLAREYGLSPEWIRRICEDQEEKAGRAPEMAGESFRGHSGRETGIGAEPVFTVYDFCGLCTDDAAVIQIYDLNPKVEKCVFVGSLREAMRSDYAKLSVESYDLDESGMMLNIVTEG